jgi:rare lipoprotein A
MNKLIVILIFTICIWVEKVFPQPTSSTASHPRHKPKGSVKVQYGTASFYADKFEGRSTASGEIFRQQKMTAASNSLSLNTWVKVTNLRNQKTVVVRITDRMNHNNKRLIDLSRAAAKQLGFTGRGITRVRVNLLDKKKYPQAPSG